MNTQATMVAVQVQASVIEGLNDVRIVLANNESENIGYVNLTPSAARRHALRILQTCELAEGKPPVNA